MAETRTAAQMTRLVAQWRKSGESGASFARRHRMPTWAFWYWCRKLVADPAKAPASAWPSCGSSSSCTAAPFASRTRRAAARGSS